MYKKFLIILSLFLFTQVNTAYSQTAKCSGYKSDNYCFNLKFEKISRKSDSKFSVEIIDLKTSEKIKPKKLAVKLWMVMKNGHEHGSEDVKIETKGDGYFVSDVWLLMLGEWQIKISGLIGKNTFNVSVPVCVKRDSSKSSVGSCK